MNIEKDISDPVVNVFKSEFLVSNIVNHLATWDEERCFADIKKSTRSFLEMRRVSTVFNSACLSSLRSKHQRLSIKPGDPILWMQFNDIVLKPSKRVDCFRFFRNVVNLNLASVHFLHSPNPHCHHELMEILIETNRKPVRFIIGDGEFCPLDSECLPCQRYIPHCKDYGPITLNLIQNGFPKPHHFSRLRVTERLLSELAKLSTAGITTKKECMSNLNSLINPNISCDFLHILIRSETFRKTVTNTECFAREVVEEMIRIWKVRTVSINFRTEYDLIPPDDWSSELLTPFKFNQDPSNIQVSSFRLDKVIVDVVGSDIYFNDSDPYLNLFSNIKLLFPSKTLLIHGPGHQGPIVFERLLVNVLSNVWKDSDDETQVFFEIFEDGFNCQERPEAWLRIDNDWRWDRPVSDYPMVNQNTIQGFTCNRAPIQISREFESMVSKDIQKSPTEFNCGFSLNRSRRKIHFRIALSKWHYEFVTGDEDAAYKLDTDFQKRIFTWF